jgi:CheY-like chemotaxis protein
MSDLVAKIPAFISIKRDEEVLLDSGEGEVQLHREALTFAAPEFEQRMPLSACQDLKVVTVPDDYSGLLDETIALQFQGTDSEWEVILHADTDTTERFVTVLLKLLLDETSVLVSAVDELGDSHTKERGTLTLAAGSETVHLGRDGALVPVTTDRLLTVDTTPLSDGSIRAVQATQLTDDSVVRTEIAFQSRRRRRFLRRYLEFRQERSGTAGPLSVLLLDPSGSHGDAIRGTLSDRRPDVAIATTGSVDTAIDALGETSLDCIAAVYDPREMDCMGFLDDVRAQNPALPLVFFTTDEDVTVVDVAPDHPATLVLGLTELDSPLARLTDEIEGRAMDYRRAQFADRS